MASSETMWGVDRKRKEARVVAHKQEHSPIGSPATRNAEHSKSYCEQELWLISANLRAFQVPAAIPHSFTANNSRYAASSSLSTSICRATVCKLGPPIAALRSTLASKSNTPVTSASNFGESFCSCSNDRSDIWTWSDSASATARPEM